MEFPASVSLTEFERKQQLRDRSRNLAKNSRMKIINTHFNQPYQLSPGTQLDVERPNLFF